MKHSAFPAFLVALFCAAPLRAQTNSGSWVQNVNFTLTAYITASSNTNLTSSKITTVSIATKDVIQALGDAIAANFSASARLLLKQPLGSDEPPVFIVRDGNPATDTGISGQFLELEQSLPIAVSRTNQNGTVTGTAYGSITVNVATPKLAFGLSGFAKNRSGSLVENHVVLAPDLEKQLSASVSGLGSILSGVPAAIRGTFALSGGKHEAQ